MKKAELQIQESILVLFVFFIILGISLTFFYQYQSSNINADRFRYEQTRYYESLANIPNMPELRCSSLTDEEDCIDTLKLLNLDQSKINLGKKQAKIILLDQDTEILCTKSSYPTCNAYLLYDKTTSQDGLVIKSPVSLFYPLTEEYKPAILELRWQA